MKPLPVWAFEQLRYLGWLPSVGGSLRDIIADYQRFHGLESTGELDEDTREHITLPRFCALPDVMPIGATLAKWPTNKLLWCITANLPGVGKADQRAAFAQAWAYWSEVANVSGSETMQANLAQVLMGARSIDGAMGVLAESELANGNMAAKRQWYDTGEPWVIAEKSPAGKIDLVRVACHELGHMLGIPHIGNGNLMAPIYSPTIRKPQAGDIAEIQARYGKPVQAPAPVPPTTVPPGAPAVTHQIDFRVDGVIVKTVQTFADGSIKVA